MNIEKLLDYQVLKKATMAIHFNLPQVCPSALPFLLAVLFITSFHVLSSYLYVSLSSPTVPTLSILTHFVTLFL